MLWLSIYLPLLPLEIFEQDEKNSCKAVAIVEQKKILLCNQAAQNQGIEQGLSKASALALCNTLTLIERDIFKEKKILITLAELTYQFSSQVAVYSNSKNQHSLLLEISNSFRLFNGIDALLQKIHQQLDSNGLTHCGFNHYFGIEKTPSAAELLARYQYYRASKKNSSAITLKLFDTPVNLLDCSITNIQHCEQLGLDNLGDIMQLPKSALSRRFNKSFTDYLAKLDGTHADLPQFFAPPDFFIRDLFFIDGLHNQANLQYPVEKMLGMLCSYLQQRQLKTHEIVWTFTRFSKFKQKIPVYFSAAQNNFDTLRKLSLMHIEKLPLDSPVESIALYSKRFTCLEINNQDFFEPAEKQNDIHLLADTLKARLGEHVLWQVSLNSSHLPEKTNCLVPFKDNNKKLLCNIAHQNALPQPAWLLKIPEKLTQSKKGLFRGAKALYIVRGPERIETAWWKKKEQRDYFIAKSVIEKNSCAQVTTTFYWIYHDGIRSSWYLHGIYS